MKRVHWQDVAAEIPTDAGAEGIGIRWAIRDAPNVALRVFDVAPRGHTPFHTHNWEHAVFVLEGNGTVRRADGVDEPIIPGDTVYVAPNEPHNFANAGDDVFRFICVIPSSGQCLALGEQ